MPLMKSKILIPFLILLVSQTVSALPTAKITIKVIDEQGIPVEGASTGIGFEVAKSKGWGVKSHRVTGLTNLDGLFVGEGSSNPHVTFSANKKGYYGAGSKFTSFTDVTGIFGFRKYKPWNPTVELVLKKIINPIPMYAVNRGAPRRGELPEIPVIGRFVGFDLMANDWVVPHGQGTHRDFLFKVEVARSISYQDYDVTLTLNFSNKGDGILVYEQDSSKGKSQLLFPRHAPVTGYVDELIQRYINTPGVPIAGPQYYDTYTNYFFRVRTELDNDGNVVGGLYGKIRGHIKLTKFLDVKNVKPNVSFNYYLNPNNNDTNIEYDPEKNLFKNVPHRLKVSRP